MLALFVLRPSGGTTTFALENAGRAAAFSGHLIVVTLLLLGLTMRPPYRGFASAGSWINHNNVNFGACIGGASVPWINCPSRNGGPGRFTPALSPGLGPSAPSYFGRCAGHPGCKIAAPFFMSAWSRSSCFAEGPNAKEDTCKQTFSPATPALAQNRLQPTNASSPPSLR